MFTFIYAKVYAKIVILKNILRPDFQISSKIFAWKEEEHWGDRVCVCSVYELCPTLAYQESI